MEQPPNQPEQPNAGSFPPPYQGGPPPYNPPNQPPYNGQPPYNPPPGQPPYGSPPPPYQGQPAYGPPPAPGQYGPPPAYPYQPAPPPSRSNRVAKGCLFAVAILVGLFVILGIIRALLGPSTGSVFSAVSKGTATGPIKTVEMSRSFQDFPAKAIDTTTVFKPTDSPLHCVVTLNSGTAKDVKIKASWYVVSAAGLDNESIKDLEFVTDGKKNVLDFYLTYNKDWPVGTYRVDIFVDDALNRTVNFSVQ